MYTYFDLSTYPLAALSGKLRGAVNGYDRKAFAESQPMVATERCLGLTIMVASQHVLKQTAAVSQDVSVNN
jgi:ribosomal protein S8